MNQTPRAERLTIRIPRHDANWIAVVRLAPVAMPVALDERAASAVTTRIPVTP